MIYFVICCGLPVKAHISTAVRAAQLTVTSTWWWPCMFLSLICGELVSKSHLDHIIGRIIPLLLSWLFFLFYSRLKWLPRRTRLEPPYQLLVLRLLKIPWTHNLSRTRNKDLRLLHPNNCAITRILQYKQYYHQYNRCNETLSCAWVWRDRLLMTIVLEENFCFNWYEWPLRFWDITELLTLRLSGMINIYYCL